MNIKTLIKKMLFPNTYSEQAYINYLRNKQGIDIGENCKIWSPNNTYIDTQRPHMLHIGKEVKITRGVTILCHDYSRSVFCGVDGLGNVGEARVTYIGDNVFIGNNAIILMGAHIGNNCIVGAGAVVSGEFSDNMVIAGNPARQICTIEDLYKKRKSEELYAAKTYAELFYRKFNRYPNVDDMTNAFFWLYSSHDLETVEDNQKMFELSGTNKQQLINNFIQSKPVYNCFDDFIKDVFE